jgi:hypothetical protein
MNPRWDADTRGYGVGDAHEHVEPVRLLLEAMQDDEWVAEEPEKHLLPHIEQHCKKNGGIWSLGPARLGGTRYDVTLQWRRRGRVSVRDLTGDVFALIGSFAEANIHVSSYIYEQSFIFQITTGLLDGDGVFAGHGHTLSLTVEGPSVELLLKRRG